MFTSHWNILIKEIGFWRYIQNIKLFQNQWFLFMTMLIFHVCHQTQTYYRSFFEWELCYWISLNKVFFAKRARPAHWYSRPSQQIEPSEDIQERQTFFLKIFLDKNEKWAISPNTSCHKDKPKLRGQTLDSI